MIIADELRRSIQSLDDAFLIVKKLHIHALKANLSARANIASVSTGDA